MVAKENYIVLQEFGIFNEIYVVDVYNTANMDVAIQKATVHKTWLLCSPI